MFKNLKSAFGRFIISVLPEAENALNEVLNHYRPQIKAKVEEAFASVTYGTETVTVDRVHEAIKAAVSRSGAGPAVGALVEKAIGLAIATGIADLGVGELDRLTQSQLSRLQIYVERGLEGAHF